MLFVKIQWSIIYVSVSIIKLGHSLSAASGLIEYSVMICITLLYI